MEREPLTAVMVSESPVEKFREFLEIRGEKLTEPRRVLVRHIFNSRKHFDADELVRDLHDASHHVSRSTVYRTLRLLVEAGLLRELRLTNRSAFEHDYGSPTHDHLHCTSCNRIVEFRNDEVLKLRDSLSLAHGFRPSGHRFLISGICSACSRAHTPAAAGLDLMSAKLPFAPGKRLASLCMSFRPFVGSSVLERPCRWDDRSRPTMRGTW